MRTALGMAFVAAIAAMAIYLAQRPTIASGKAIAARMTESLKGKHIASVVCDEAPIDHYGAVTHCAIAADTGETGQLEVTIDRGGETAVRMLAPTVPAQ